MAIKESWEKEEQDKIDYCLNCTLPPECCHGKGYCTIKSRRYGEKIEDEIIELIHMGLNRSQIYKRLGIRNQYVHEVIERLVEKGKITREEADATRLNKKKREKGV